MICYKDTTFCSSKNCKNECGRKLTPDIIEAAIKWWGSEDAPITVAKFCIEDKVDDISEWFNI